MQTRIKVVKTDGSEEEYLHTKVFGTISNALDSVGQLEVSTAEQLAEVVTYFIYNNRTAHKISSSEILSIIEATLTATRYEQAAMTLSEHHFERKLKRCRTEVVSVDIRELADAELLCKSEELQSDRSRWDKFRIVEHLVAQYNVDRQTARTIASMVENKIFSMGVNVVPVSLIKQLVLNDTAAILRAQQQLQSV